METVNTQSLQTDYLQLFVTQVRNQNPLEPMEQENFLAQLAQFSMVEGIEKMSEQLTRSADNQNLAEGANLVGKGVSYQLDDSDVTVSGVVNEVRIDHDGLFAQVNGESIPFSEINSVYQV